MVALATRPASSLLLFATLARPSAGVYRPGGRRHRLSGFRSSELRTTSTSITMYAMVIALLSITTVLSVSHVLADPDPHPCNAADPEFQECNRFNLQHLIPQLANGLPNIRAEPIEPMRGLPSLRHSSPGGGLNVQLDDVSISGLSTAIVTDMHVDLATNTFRIVLTFPAEIVATGVHSTDAEIMGIPMKGSGTFKATLVQPTLQLTLRGAPSLGPDGQSYLQLSSAETRLQLGPISAEVGGLFSQYPPLERASNAVAEELRPSVERWLAGILLRRAQAVFGSVPYDVLFPGRSSLYSAFPSLQRPLPLPASYYK